MTEPLSHLIGSSPRLHYLEWNPAGRVTVVLLHGNSANAWWWAPVAREISHDLRLLALDQRGHGDSEWVRPPAYTPVDYARDLAVFLGHVHGGAGKPVIVGHSMGGLTTLAFAANHPELARGAVVIDAALTSSRGRDRYLRRLRALPVVTYPDLETARQRFRLMPNEGGIPAETVHAIAEKSLAITDDKRWTLKFDRESFFGGDGINPMDAIKALRFPTLLMRAEMSRIMTAEATAVARDSNPHVRLITIPASHHHVLLEKPGAVARALEEFIASL